MTMSNRVGTRPASTSRSSKRIARRRVSLSWSSFIRSVMLMRSKMTSWSSLTLVRLSTFSKASSSENTPVLANGAGPSGTGSPLPRPNTSFPSVPRSARSAAAALYFWYSSSRRTSSARGSSSSSPGSPSSCPSGTLGSSIFDLMWASVAAITRYSLATSIVSVRITLRYWRNFSVTKLMGMSRMSSSCCWMRCSKRSSGPSKPAAGRSTRYWPSNATAPGRPSGSGAAPRGASGEPPRRLAAPGDTAGSNAADGSPASPAAPGRGLPRFRALALGWVTAAGH